VIHEDGILGQLGPILRRAGGLEVKVGECKITGGEDELTVEEDGSGIVEPLKKIPDSRIGLQYEKNFGRLIFGLF